MRRISFAAALVAAAPGVLAMRSTGWLEAFGGAGIAMVTPRPGELVDAALPQAADPWWRQ